MVETVHGEADDPSAARTSRVTFEELAAEPERIATAATAGPVRIDRPDGEPLVLLSAAQFDRLNGHGPRARHASEWSDRELELLRTQPIPDEAAEFDDEGGFVGHG